MALTAMSRSDNVRHVAKTDPAYSSVMDWVDPENHALGKKQVETIGDDATIFLLKGLDVFLMGHIYDTGSVLSGTDGSDEVSIHTRLNKTNIEAVRFGVSGFENFRDEKGNDIKLKTVKRNINGRSYTGLADEILDLLDIETIADVAEKVKAISRVSKDREGNSGRASPPSD